MGVSFRLVLIGFFTLISACAPKEPEGPAERIGKSIDMMSKGIQDLDKEWAEMDRQERQAREREKLEREERRKLEGSDYYRYPKSDSKDGDDRV